MAANHLTPWHDDHSFGQDVKRPGEMKTFVVIAITAVMMVVEIAAGLAYGSMALLADGLHMASHAAALTISAFAYIYARRHAHDDRFNFGTGKVNALGGFAGAVLLGSFAGVMVLESIKRFLHPEEISFGMAILVAVIGLVVNVICALVLGHSHGPHEDGHDHGHSHDHGDHNHAGHDHDHDHNLKAAYFHVIADALTSVLAIGALLAGLYLGWSWLDPLMGIVGAALVARWSLGLVRTTGRVLLDQQASQSVQDAVRNCIEEYDDHRVVDLHVWSIGPQIYAAEIVVLAEDPQPPYYYKKMLPSSLGLAHVIVEVHAGCISDYTVREAS